MKTSPSRRSLPERLVRRFASSHAVLYVLSRTLHYVDRPVLEYLNGRFDSAFGFSFALLTTTGARTGLSRSIPLIYFEDGQNVILIGSNFGRARNPAWYYNLKANPEARVHLHKTVRYFNAREALGAEREELWQKAVVVHEGYTGYQERAVNRRIPVMVLTPSETDEPHQLR
jgi:deazaflavin-dependent oxidoreductase (nitroreductase family)